MSHRFVRVFQIILLGSLTALAPLSIDMYLPALPSLSQSLHASPSMAQLSLTFCLFGLAVGQLFGGAISDTLGRRKPLLLGMMIFTVTSLWAGSTHSIYLFLLLRLFQGFSGAMGIVIARAIARDYYDGPELTRFFALLMMINGLAPIAAPILGGQLLRITSWQGVFYVLFATGVLLVVGVFLTLPESLTKEKRISGGVSQLLRTQKSLLFDRVFMGYVLTQGFVMAAMFAYIAGSPFVVQKIYGLSPQAFSAIFAMNGLGIIVVGQVSAFMAKRYVERYVLTVGVVSAFFGGIMLFIMLLIHAPLYLVLIPLFIVVASIGNVSTLGSSLAMHTKGEQAGSAAGMIGVISMLFGALVSPLVGLGGQLSAMPMAYVIVACEILGMIMYFVITQPLSVCALVRKK